MLATDNTDLRSLLQCLKENIFATFNCHGIGRITEFNSINQTCTIEVLQLKEVLNNVVTPSIICDVPLIIYGTYNSYITLPNPVGCNVMLFFMDRNLDAFMQTGERYLPETARKHNITDCVAMLMFRDYTHSIGDYDLNALTLTNKTTDNVANFKITNKFKMQNNEQDLASLIQEFLVACEGITTANNVLTAASKKKFTDLKTKFGELLQ